MPDADDQLDGCLAPVDVAPEDETADADVPYVVLFADVDPADDAALRWRVEQYEALFGGGA